jgi:protein required for attachment to host cells
VIDGSWGKVHHSAVSLIQVNYESFDPHQCCFPPMSAAPAIRRDHAMDRIPGLYFVIARNDRARFVRPDPEDSLHTVGFVDLPALRDNRTDRSEPHGPPAADQHCFAPLLAKRIGEDLAVDLFTDLVLVAPPDVLQELLQSIDAATAGSLLGVLARDLVAVPDLELWPHLLRWLHVTAVSRESDIASHN